MTDIRTIHDSAGAIIALELDGERYAPAELAALLAELRRLRELVAELREAASSAEQDGLDRAFLYDFGEDAELS